MYKTAKTDYTGKITLGVSNVANNSKMPRQFQIQPVTESDEQKKYLSTKP